MKWAVIVELGGELIHAEKADYANYKGFLKCEKCKEPVFLRKAHFKNGRQIAAAFVHHKAIPEVSICEDRVGKYKREDVERISSEARHQRLIKLQISIWKFLKKNMCLDLNTYARFRQDTKKSSLLNQVVEYGNKIFEEMSKHIIEETFPKIAEMFRNKDERIGVTPIMEKTFDNFIENNKADWELHTKIAKEALELFLTSNAMRDVRIKMLICLCHPEITQLFPELLDLDTSTDKWKIKFLSFVTLQICFIFISVPWIEEFKKQRG
jgi:hypothetical protein